MIKQFSLQTNAKYEMINITDEVANLVKDVKDKVITVFIPHTTAAVTLNENADDDVKSDLLMKWKKMAKDNYNHSEGNSDGHLLSSLVGCSEQIIVEDGSLVLGTWQGIYFCEFDGPRKRKVIVDY